MTGRAIVVLRDQSPPALPPLSVAAGASHPDRSPQIMSSPGVQIAALVGSR